MKSKLSWSIALIALGLTPFTVVGACGTLVMAAPRGTHPGSRPVKEHWLVVSLPKKVFRPGEPITASIEFRNLTIPEVTIWIAGFYPNHKVVVKDEAGVEPPLTDFGRICRDVFSPVFRIRDQNFPRTIKRGGKYLYEVGGIDRLYNLAPGNYWLEVTYHDESEPTPLRINSNSEKFQVK